MKKTVAVVGGTFDPITIGHEAFIKRAENLFETVYVSICCNSEKNCMFSLEERLEMISSAFKNDNNVVPIVHNGLIADLAKEKNAVILKGLRYSSDFDYEHIQAESNYMINGTETIFLSSHADDTFITSSLVRELIKANKPFEAFVSKAVSEKIKYYLQNKD